MAAKLTKDPEGTLRKQPGQKRSKATIGFITDAAALILRRNGEAAVTTTAVAERAGVSVGTVYQYFADRDALLVAVADRDRQAFVNRLRRILAQSGSLDDPVREFVRALIKAMIERQRARRQFAILATSAMTAQGEWRRNEFIEIIAEFWARKRDGVLGIVNHVDAFVLTHAMFGVLHAAAVSNPAIMEEPEFERVLCDIIWTVRRSGAAASTGPTP